MLLPLTACEESVSEKKTPAADKSNDRKDKTSDVLGDLQDQLGDIVDDLFGDDNKNDNSAVSSEVTPAHYLSITNWQGDIYWGTNDEGTTIAVDAKGSKLFELPDNRSIEGTFIGDYALITNGGVIDKKGNIVFELSESQFDSIYFSDCLDVGYILCSEDVNTFEETGTHYFAVDVKNGNSRRFTGDDINDFEHIFRPSSVGKYNSYGWTLTRYFENGYFVYSYSSYGHYFHTIYNIVENKSYTGYIEDENGGKNNYVFDTRDKWSYVLKGTTVYCTTETYSSSLCEYDLSTGRIKEIYRLDESGSWFTYEGGSVFGSLYHECLVDVDSNVFIYMKNDYSTYCYHRRLANSSYLLGVTNEGGGSFVTVINKNAIREFEPIIVESISSSVVYSNESYFILQDYENSDTLVVYDYDGNKITSFSSKTEPMMGDSTILCQEDDNIVLFNTKTGSKTALDKDLISNMSDCDGYSFNGYVVSNDKTFLLHEDGSVVYFITE